MASFPQGFYGAAHWPPTSLKALILKAVGLTTVDTLPHGAHRLPVN